MPWERRGVLQHLAVCPQCTRELTELHALLQGQDLLPPAPLLHPLEQALGWLRRLLPLPPWAWHLILFGITPLLWIALVDVSSVSFLQTVRHTLEPWPAALLMTTHFVWLQARLRQLMVRLWQAGVPPDDVDAFQRRYLSSFQGTSLGGGWLFFGLAILAIIVNWLIFPPEIPWERVKLEVIGFYALGATIAMYWSWLQGGHLLRGLADLWRRHPALLAQPETKRVRHLAAGWVAVAGGSMAWHFAFSVGVPEVGLAMRVWGVAVFLILLALWSGYAVLEWCMAQRPTQLRWAWQPALRLLFTLLMLGLTLASIYA